MAFYAGTLFPTIDFQLLPEVSGLAVSPFEIPDCRTALANRILKNRFHAVDQSFIHSPGYAAGRYFRVNPGTEQCLTRIDITDTDDDLLIHQKIFDRNNPFSRQPIEIVRVKVNTERFRSKMPD